MARLKIGDVIEIKTAIGFTYAHYTHRNKEYGPLLSVFCRFYDRRPTDLAIVVEGKPTFKTFFYLNYAVDRQIVSIVGNVKVPADAKAFPLFRAGIPGPGTSKVENWWLWDGEKEWMVGNLTKEQLSLPIRSIPDETLLIERIEEGWTPETDPSSV